MTTEQEIMLQVHELREKKKKRIEIARLKFQINEIDKWLQCNDWKVNKVVIGEWSKDDERWLDYLKERNEKRKLRDELIEKINVIER